MKKLIICLVFLFSISGCEGPFAAGVGTGVAIQEIADKSEQELISVMHDVNLKKDELRSLLVDNRGREKDPVFWVAVASILGNVFWGGKSYASRKTS